MTAIPEINVLVPDLEDLYITLVSVQTYLEANDVAKSQLNFLAETRYSPLTQDIQQRVARVKGLLDDHIVKQHYESKALPVDPPDVGSLEIPEEQLARMEPLPPHPLGSFHIQPPTSPVAEDAQRVD